MVRARKGKTSHIVESARVEAQGLIEMYQAGFLDGFNNRLVGKKKLFKSLRKRCIKAFQKRFKQVINPALKKS